MAALVSPTPARTGTSCLLKEANRHKKKEWKAGGVCRRGIGFSWGFWSRVALCSPCLVGAGGGSEGEQPAVSLSFVCKILIAVWQAARPPKHKGEVAVFARLENHSMSCQRTVASGCGRHSRGLWPNVGVFGDMLEQGENMREEQEWGGKVKEAVCSCSVCSSKVTKTVYQAPLCHQTCLAPMAGVRLIVGMARAGTYWASFSQAQVDWLRSRVAEGSKAQAVLLPVLCLPPPSPLPQPSPSSLLCVWQLNTEARERMADCTHARQPGMLAFSSSGCRQGSVSDMSGEKPKKKAFYLVRMKPLKEPTTTNNNVSFVIHCHIGKEIKHICSNCSRGEEARDGECWDPVGVGERQGSVFACMGGCVYMCALLSEAGMLGLPLHRCQGKRKGSAGGMCWASIQPIDQRDAKRDRSPHLPQKLCANS